MQKDVEATKRSRYTYTMRGKTFKPPIEEENIIMRLPSHITLEILSRLPVKTIIHCKSVCKAWRTLLSDPCFPHLHLAKSPVNLMFYNDCPFPRYWLIEFEEDFRKKRNLSKFKDECLVLAGGKSKFEHVVGSCNGLICLSAVIEGKGEQYCVWNPVKNDNVILPMPNLKETTDRYFVSRASGFGFCPRTNVYKVIRMVGYSGMASRNEAMCEVYTLGTNAWRTIQDVPCPNSAFSIPSVNGAVHWFIEEDVHTRVCAFRIDDEKWDPFLLPLPLVNSANRRYYSELGVVENCLVIFDTSQFFCLDIWMMEDYGVKDSWTKCWSIGTHGDPYFLPLKLTEDGNLLMYTRSNPTLVCFNPQTRSIIRKQKIYGLPNRYCRYAGPYVASFISPTEVMKGRMLATL